MIETRFAWCRLAVLGLVLFLTVSVQAAPVPLLEADRNATWAAAWEKAWEIAWETPSEFTVEFSGDPQGNEPLELNIAFTGGEGAPASSPQVLEVSWGLSPAVLEATFTGADTASVQMAGYGLPWSNERAFHESLRLGKLFVETTPADASVRLLNAEVDFRQGMDLSAGQYVLEVTRSGYDTQVRRVEVLAGMAATVRMDLVQVAQAGGMPVYLPPAPAVATDEQLAKHLATPGPQPAAEHVAATPIPQPMSVIAQSQERTTLVPLVEEPTSAPLTVQVAEAAQPVAQAEPQVVEPLVTGAASEPGSLRVAGVPEDARIRILNIRPRFEQGMQLEPGVYTLEVQHHQHLPQTREVIVAAGVETLVELALEPAPLGRLFVKTAPEGAHVRLLDIRPRFEQGMALAPGTYTVDATISGYRTEVRTVEVTAGADQELEISLERVAPTGHLYVETQPAGATVRVLGILPRFRQGLELEAGTYTVDATLPGQEPVRRTVEIKAGQDNRYLLALHEPQGEDAVLNAASQPGGELLVTPAVALAEPVLAEPVLAEPVLAEPVLPQAAEAAAPVRPVAATVVETAAPLAEDEILFPTADGADSVLLFDTAAFLSMAQLAFNAGDYLGTLQSCTQVLRLDAHNVEAFALRAQALAALGQHADALEALEQGLALVPASAALMALQQDILAAGKSRMDSEAAGSRDVSLEPTSRKVYEN